MSDRTNSNGKPKREAKRMPRREFLQLFGLGAGIVLTGCGREWWVPSDAVEGALRGPGIESFKHTLCGLCDAGCGVTVRLVDGAPVGIKGNPRHPVNRGGLCPVGHAGLDVLYAPERLSTPLKRVGDGRFEAVSWEQALDEITAKLRAAVESGNGHRIAMLNDRRSELFEPLAERFLRTLGSTSFSSSHASMDAGYRHTQGVDRMPGFDLGHSDLVVSFGLDLFEDGPSPVHTIASMIGSRPDGERGRLIHIGTRLSPSAAKADQHLAVLPGSAGAAALGIAHVLLREGNVDRRFLREHCFGFDGWTDEDHIGHRGFEYTLLEDYYPERAAQLCGCSAVALVRAARQIARAERPVALVGGEALDFQNATFTVMAVHALNAMMGAFGRPGGVVMPGRLPLVPLKDIGGTEPASCFDAPSGLPGVDPVRALVDAAGEIEALFLIESNPLHESPYADDLREALHRIPLVVALSSFPSESSRHADFVLPAHAPFEAWQDCTTPGGVPFSYVGVAEPVIQPIHDTRHVADVVLELARRLGGTPARELPWQSYEIYLKHRLGGLFTSGEGTVISGSFEADWAEFLEKRGWRFLEHADFERLWTDLVEASGWWNPVISHGDWARLLPTESGKFEFYSNSMARQLELLGDPEEAASTRSERVRAGAAKLGLAVTEAAVCQPHFEPAHGVGEGELWVVPFRPLSARGPYATKSAMLLAMFGFHVLRSWSTWVELSPETARDLHVGDGDTVALESERGSIEAVVCLNAGAMPGVANVALGLGHELAEGIDAGIGANPTRIVARAHDSLTGAIALAATRVRLRMVRRRPRGEPVPAEGGHV